MTRPRIDRVEVAVPSLGRRPLASMLAELNAQARTVAQEVTVVVLDNTPTGSPRIATDARTAGAVVVHVASPGVASVRNAALDHALVSGADAIVMIDDDELPEPGWLATHLDAAQRYDVDLVLGPVPVHVPAGAPRWFGDGSVLRDVQGEQSYAAGPFDGPLGAGNTLVRTSIVRSTGVRFDPAFDTTGGEDTVFFARLREHGAVAAWCPDAVAVEHQDLERLTLRGFVARRYAQGQRAVLVERALYAPSPARTTARRGYRILRGIATMVVGALTLRAPEAAKGLGQVSYGLGSLTALLGARPSTYGAGSQ